MKGILLNFNNLFYKPKRLTKKTKLQKLRLCALFLSLISTLGIVGFLLSKYSKNKKDVNNTITFNINESLNSLTGNIMIPFEGAYFDFEEVISSQSLEEEKVEEIDIDAFIKERVTSTDYVKRALEVASALRESVKDVPNEVKYQYAVNKFFNNSFEFNEFQGTITGEAKGKSYEDALATITSVFNRLQHDYKCDFVRDKMHIYDRPITLYDHITCDGQYSVYLKGTYKLYIGRQDDAYQAILDFLYTLDKTDVRMHDLLNFRSSGTEVSGATQFVGYGNKYFTHIDLKELIPFEELYFNSKNVEVIYNENDGTVTVVTDEESNSLVLEKDK